MSKQVRISGKIRNCFRSDTLSKWETDNPVLLKGEIGVVIGLNEVGDGLEDKSQKIKIGDGIHSWKELSWFSSGGTSTLDIDQTYNPESTNAQSGKALAPIFQKKLEIWKNSTAYKQDSVVMTNIITEEQGQQTVFLKCLIDHTSGNAAPDPISDNLNAWDIVGYLYAAQAYTASKAASDIEGNYIPNTYATKEELAFAIGEALEGEY